MTNLNVNDKALVVLNDNDANVVLSAKNIPTVKTALTNTINVFDILKYDTIVIETGSDRVKIKFKKYAIQTNHTANEKIQAEREAAKAAMAEKKGKKSKKDEE